MSKDFALGDEVVLVSEPLRTMKVSGVDAETISCMWIEPGACGSIVYLTKSFPPGQLRKVRPPLTSASALPSLAKRRSKCSPPVPGSCDSRAVRCGSCS